MRLLRAAILTLVCTAAFQAQQTITAPRRSPGRNPNCALGAICFSGEVWNGKDFRHSVSSSLSFVLEPESWRDPNMTGWTIAIVPTQTEGDCKEFASVVNAPYRAHRQLYIDESYGWTAQDEMDDSPREFYFVTNCADYRAESERLEIVLWGDGHTDQEIKDAQAKLGSSPLGQGHLWIRKYKITHPEDSSQGKTGKIEWMQFSVEIKLPKSYGHGQIRPDRTIVPELRPCNGDV